MEGLVKAEPSTKDLPLPAKFLEGLVKRQDLNALNPSPGKEQRVDKIDGFDTVHLKGEAHDLSIVEDQMRPADQGTQS